MHTVIPHTKDRLRDEAQLAFMAFVLAGHSPTKLRPSLAPVCVPCYQQPKPIPPLSLTALLSRCGC